MMACKTRSQKISHAILGVTYAEVEHGEGDFAERKLPRGIAIIGRILNLSKKEKGKQSTSIENACLVVAQEIHDLWVYVGNVYPKNVYKIVKSIKQEYQEFSKIQSYSAERKLAPTWISRAEEFNNRMTKQAYDVRTYDTDYKKKLEEKYDVKMTQEEEDFYKDNCHGERIRTSSHSVCKVWLKSKLRRDSDKESLERRKIELEEAEKQEVENKASQIQEALDSVDTFQGKDEDFVPSKEPDINHLKYSTRSSNEAKSDNGGPVFPDIPVRRSMKDIDEKFIRITTQICADYTLPIKTAILIVRDVSNGLFDQRYEVEMSMKKDDEAGTDSNENDIVSDEEQEHQIRRRSKSDYTHTLPSERSVKRYLEDANLLNLKYLSDQVLSKEEETVVTLGLDDTTKAAGNKVHDVKTTQFTLQGPNRKRENLTTGFHENASKAGKEASKQISSVFKMLAALAECSEGEIKDAIDFFIADRAGDVRVMLRELGIEDEKVLKCTAHIILCCDYVMDKIFRQNECDIGVNNLLNVSAGTQHFCGPNTSIFTIASIALAKLLSPSHSAQSISLFTEFNDWCKTNSIDLAGFKGFQANRFGRIASNAKEFLKYQSHIVRFFEEVVVESDNKLVTACAHYITNRWYIICCEIYTYVAELVIFPLMDLLGIDKAKKTKRDDRNWIGIHNFFEKTLPKLTEEKEKHDALEGGKNALTSEILSALVNGIKHQLQEMKFFDAISAIDTETNETVSSASQASEPGNSSVTTTKKKPKSRKRKCRGNNHEVFIEVPTPLITISIGESLGTSTSIEKDQDKIQEDEKRCDDSIGEKNVKSGMTVSKETLAKLKYAPGTNLGCESNFSVLTAMVGKTGGGVSIQTLSCKRVVSQNKFLVRPELLNLPAVERKSWWTWARRSEAAQKARSIEAEMMESIQRMKKLALEVKMQRKKKKIIKVYELLEDLKDHGGPLTPNTIDSLLPCLTSKQLILEISYLRAVACPDIKQKRLVIEADGSRHMVQFPDEVLRMNIRNAIKPESDVQDIDAIIDKHFEKRRT